MKNLQSHIEGTWIELVQVELTEKEQTLLMSKEESDKEAKVKLLEKIKTEREKPASKEDAELVQKLYEGIKPKLEEGQTYELIAMNASFSEKRISGIINFRVNGEHKQIRF
jgi:hypothetical protein